MHNSLVEYLSPPRECCPARDGRAFSDVSIDSIAFSTIAFALVDPNAIDRIEVNRLASPSQHFNRLCQLWNASMGTATP
jgi:hypothetical protein